MRPAAGYARSGQVGVVTLDNPPVNTLTPEAIARLSDAFDTAFADADTQAIVLRATGRAFSAGLPLEDCGPTEPRALAELCDRIAAAPKPVVACLNGSALGGGLELALAAHVRIALETVRLAFPEIAYGLAPAAGGTRIAPRLAGAAAALDLMLSGRAISAAEATAMGLIDRVVTGDLTEAALAEAARADRRAPRAPLSADAYLAETAARRASVSGSHIPAARRIVDCVEAALLLPDDIAAEQALAAFEDCHDTPQSRALRHIARAERHGARLGTGAVPRTPRLVALSGTPDAALAGLAARIAGAGIPVLLLDVPALRDDIAAHAADRARHIGRSAGPGAVMAGGIGAQVALVDLVLTTEPRTAHGRDLPAGASVARVGAVPVADWSGLELAPRPSQRRGCLEFRPGRDDPDGDAALAVGLARAAGLAPLRVGAVGLGDRVMAAGTGLIEAAAIPSEAVRAALWPQGFPDEFLARLGGTEAGEAELPGWAASPASLRATILAVLADEGARCLADGAAAVPSDIDVALVQGAGFPRWLGGPMHWAYETGPLPVRSLLRALGEAARGRAPPAPIWDDFVKDPRRLT